MSVLIKGGRIIIATADYVGDVYVDGERITLVGEPLDVDADYNLYEGTEVTGPPEVVLLRGTVLVESGELVADPGVGQFVERAAFGQELLPAAAR